MDILDVLINADVAEFERQILENERQLNDITKYYSLVIESLRTIIDVARKLQSCTDLILPEFPEPETPAKPETAAEPASVTMGWPGEEPINFDASRDMISIANAVKTPPLKPDVRIVAKPEPPMVAVFTGAANDPQIETVPVPTTRPPSTTTPPPCTTMAPRQSLPQVLDDSESLPNLSVAHRAKVYLEHAGEATSLAIAAYLGLPDANTLRRLLKSDSRFILRDKFWSLRGS